MVTAACICSRWHHHPAPCGGWRKGWGNNGQPRHDHRERGGSRYAAAPWPGPDSKVRTEFSRGELDCARHDVSQLVKESRFSQAAEVLAAVVEPASRILGSTDDEVASIRLELANVLFEGGDYRRAAPAYQKLAADLAARHGGDAEVVLRCRLLEATCHALVGHTSQALRQLDGLLLDQRRVFGEDDSRTLELRRQIGMLQLGAGQRRAAEQTLRQLMTDLTRTLNTEQTANPVSGRQATPPI